MSTPNPSLLKILLEQAQAALSLMESGTMFVMSDVEHQRLLDEYGPYDFIIGDFLVKRIHGNNLQPENLNLASNPQEAHSSSKMGDRDNEMCHLHSAIHGLQVELVRTTGDLRSLLLVLSKLDLGIESKINMKISELSGGINEVKASTLKALSEIRNRIDAADARIVILEKQLADADIPAEAETALAELKTISKQLDDIVPDVPDLPPVPTPAPTPA